MQFFYTLGIQLYWLAIRIASISHTKAKKTLQGRRHWQEELEKHRPKKDKIYWFHCSSLGEFEQARPVLEALRKNKEIGIVLSFFSPSGYEIRKDYAEADYVCYLPADTPKNAKRFLDILRPDMAVFVKYEFWYNFIHQAHKRSLPMYYFSVIFREKQHFFRPWGCWFVKHLKYITHIFVQNNNSVELAQSIGLNNISLCGDTRFDRVQSIAQEPKRFTVVEEFIGEKDLVLMGSSWYPDDKVMAAYFEKNKKDFKLIIAPHHTDEARIQQIQTLFPDSIRFTQINDRALTEEEKQASVMIIDTIGILSSLYQYAKIAYIGNGFGTGIHNTLEAAVYGLAVLFGPKYHKFQEAVDLIEQGAAFSFSTQEEFSQYMQRLLDDTEVYANAAEAAKAYVASNLGATKKIVGKLSNL